MENGKADNAANELEVVEMFGVDTRMRVDLESVIVVGRIFKQTVKRVKHLVREQEEKFSKGKVSSMFEDLD